MESSTALFIDEKKPRVDYLVTLYSSSRWNIEKSGRLHQQICLPLECGIIGCQLCTAVIGSG